MEIDNKKQYGTGYYFFLKSDTEETPFIHTDFIFIKSEQISTENGSLTLKLRKEDSQKLYDEIQKYEAKAIDVIKSSHHDDVSFLPVDWIMQMSENGEENSIRPNYWQDADAERIYLKGNYWSLRMYNVNDNSRLSTFDLGDGYYQLVIRANAIYIGAHKNPQHLFNLQLRVVQIRYSPLKPVDLDATQKEDSLSTEVTTTTAHTEDAITSVTAQNEDTYPAMTTQDEDTLPIESITQSDDTPIITSIIPAEVNTQKKQKKKKKAEPSSDVPKKKRAKAKIVSPFNNEEY